MNQKKFGPKHHISRRTMLVGGLGGLATATIGLPLLEEMLISSASAAPKASAVPVRAFNVFFGLGIELLAEAHDVDAMLAQGRPHRRRGVRLARGDL